MMTVREHLRFYARAKGVATVDRDVKLVIRKTGLQMYEDTIASKLSGGNKRKLSLGIALIGTSRAMPRTLLLMRTGNPSVLLLDEPSSSLDAESKRVLWKTLAEVSIGRSVLLTVSHASCLRRITDLYPHRHTRWKKPLRSPRVARSCPAAS